MSEPYGAPADPGPVGGAAQCSGVTGTGATMTLCAWSGGDALVGVIFLGESTAAAAGTLHTLLPAIVTKN